MVASMGFPATKAPVELRVVVTKKSVVPLSEIYTSEKVTSARDIKSKKPKNARQAHVKNKKAKNNVKLAQLKIFS
ncbi:MAG: hypothetical protein ACMXYD_02550 [Candidatus Woesearchaeota archaeon]